MLTKWDKYMNECLWTYYSYAKPLEKYYYL